MNTINNYNLNYNRNSLIASGSRLPKKSIPETAINRLGIDMSTMKGGNVKPTYVPAPDTVEPSLREFFHKLKINWASHVDPNKKTGLFT